jgi:hypothetical protein
LRRRHQLILQLVAVDDGPSDVAPVYEIDARAFAFIRLGDHLRLTVGPRCGYVFNVERLDPATGRVSAIGLPLS